MVRKLVLLSILLISSFSAAQIMQQVAATSTYPVSGAVTPAISFIGQCNGTTNCASVPSHAIGDLFIAFVGRDASTAAPTLPGGWTSVTAPSINGTSTADSVMRVACKVATTNSETITGFTNGANLVAQIYRGQRDGLTAACASTVLGTPVNFTSTVNTTSTTVTYSSVTNGDAASWDVCGAYTPAATAGLGTAPAGMTNRSISGSTKAAGHDTNAAVSSYTTANVTVTTAGRVITSCMEIKAAQAATPIFSPSSGTPPQTVTLSSATTGSGPFIHYTTNGSTPTVASTAGTSVSVSSDPTTVKVGVFSMTGWSDSAVGSALYSSAAFANVQEVAGRAVYASNLICVAAVCTLTVPSTGSGHGLTVFGADTNGANTISTVTGGCTGSWTVRAASSVDSGPTGDLEGATCDSSSSGATAIVVTFTNTPGDTIVVFDEWSWSGSSIAYDTSNGIVTGSAQTTASGPVLTLTGTTDVIITAFISSASVPTSINSPYGNLRTVTSDTSATLAVVGTAYLLNTASGTAATWNFPSEFSAMSAIALKGN